MGQRAVTSTKGKGPEEVKVTIANGDDDAGKPAKVTLCGLYRFADLKDALSLMLGSAALLVSGSNQPLQLIVFGQLMNSFNLTTKEAVKDRVHLFASFYASLGLLKIVTSSIQTSCFAAVAARQSRRIRVAYLRALTRKPMSFFDMPHNDAGALASSVMEKAMQVQVGIGDDLVQLIERVLQFAMGIACALYFSWQLALVSMAAIPLLAVVIGVANKAYARATRNSAKLLDEATSTPLEAIGAIRTVHAFGRELDVLGRYQAACKGARVMGLSMGKARAFLEGVSAPIMFLMFGSCLWYGSSLVAADMEAHEYCRICEQYQRCVAGPRPWRCTTGGSVMTSFLSVIFGFMGMLQAIPSITSLAAAKASAADIFMVLDAPPDPIDALASEASDDMTRKRATGRIELTDVTFAYPARKDVCVYSGLSLTIDAGQTVALAGPSGCGKSTLVALLERWYDVDSGALLLDGVDVRSLSVRWLRSQIGLVSQEPVLFSGSIGWNIGLGAAGGADGSSTAALGAYGPSNESAVATAARLANADGFIREMPDGYGTQVGEKGVQLSGGQKQRIAIARALVREPAVLVLDEATSALDNASERIVQAALDEIMAKQSRTTIIIAHRLSTIRNADKIAVVSGGKIVEEGAHDDLVSRDAGIYRALVDAQLSGGDPAANTPAATQVQVEPPELEPPSDTAEDTTFITPPEVMAVSEAMPIARATVKSLNDAAETVAEATEAAAAADSSVAQVAVAEMEGQTSVASGGRWRWPNGSMTGSKAKKGQSSIHPKAQPRRSKSGFGSRSHRSCIFSSLVYWRRA